MINLIKLNPRERIIAMVGLIILSSTFLYRFYFLPFLDKYKTLQDGIKQKIILIKKSETILGEKDKLIKELSRLSKKIQAKLPGGRGENQFLTTIGKIAEDTNVHIESMSVLPSRDLDFFRELSVAIDMRANLGNVVRFLYHLRKSSVVLIVNRLQLQPKSIRSALLKGKLVISTIFLKK